MYGRDGEDYLIVASIPEDMATFAAVPVGWPQGNFGPVRRRPVADVIHRNRW
ncbi:hypothetical protein SMICM17S_10295 [Streptomyces microflavus]